MIGSGEMSRLVTQYLYSKGANVTIINRTFSKAKLIADEVGKVKVEKFSQLNRLINESSLLFSATSSENPIITSSILNDVTFKRYWFDLAVPKDIDIINQSSIEIFRIDDLQDTVNQNKEEREKEIKEAHRIIGEWTAKFFQWVNTLSIEPLIKKIYLKAEESVKDEVSRAISKGYIQEREKENIEKIAHQSIKRFLHGMSKNLKIVSNDASADMLIESINYLFDFEDKNKKRIRNTYQCDYQNRGDTLIGLK